MSAAQSPSTLESRVKGLECHFTWDLDSSPSRLIRSRDELEDIGTDEGNLWLGHVYNLQGFICYKLGDEEKARRFLSQATEAFRRLKNTDEGPWLVVNFGNLAWLHHLLGEDKQSQDYLSKVDALLREHPSPSQDELHPEICAEKAWTLMKFDKDKKQLAADYFQKAIEMQPDMVHWRTSRVIGRVSAQKHSDTDLDQDIWKEMGEAREQDPDDSYLAALELLIKAKKGEQVNDEAHELEEKIILNPVSSYSGIKVLLRVYRQLDDIDQAINLAEKVLKDYPDNRYLKRCAALCYKWRIVFFRDGRPNPSRSMMERAISLHEQMIPLYPDSALMKKLDLANLHAKASGGLQKADRIYQELLRRDLEPADKQLVYNSYAKYLNFERRDWDRSITYHMKTAEIRLESHAKQNSIRALKKISERGRNKRCREIQMFLETLPEDQPE
ncbi:interferon-induced protein with tetratricopeptide repeats 1-like [Cololabis saira]|uniref:interferon-induced protein with tetratricopeptide repeats 1-like n=1 Tax=Cololabis saira TaxID=129043 RepID=UPI002AD4F2D9|nr:interferon-induced protein with tetratricopeptide repeats 1-like [Cololabis saira]